MMILDEAIKHAKEAAGGYYTNCQQEHKQLAEWLKELKNTRKAFMLSCDKVFEQYFMEKAKSIDV